MSLILDALNRSEENRNQQLEQVPKRKVLSFSGRKGRRSKSGRAILLAPLLIVVLAVAAWSLWPSSTPPVATDVGTPDAEAVRTKIVAERSSELPQAEPAPLALDTAPVPRQRQIADVVSVAPRKQAVVAPEVPQQSEAIVVAQTAATSATAPQQQNSTQESISPATELLGTFPELQVSMHYYSSDAKRSMVRINNQLLHMQDTISGQLVVDEITPKGAILAYRGRLYELLRPGN